jgi:hypothetical protein
VTTFFGIYALGIAGTKSLSSHDGIEAWDRKQPTVLVISSKGHTNCIQDERRGLLCLCHVPRRSSATLSWRFNLLLVPWLFLTSLLLLPLLLSFVLDFAFPGLFA